MELWSFDLVLVDPRQRHRSLPRGVSARAWLLTRAEAIGPEAVRVLHHDEPGAAVTVRPYALAVLPPMDSRDLDVGASAVLRLSALTAGAGAVLCQALQSLEKGKYVGQIDKRDYVLLAQRRSGSLSPSSLSVHMELPSPVLGLRWRFRTPTAFKLTSQDLSYVPTVPTLFGSLARRFQGLGGVDLPDASDSLVNRIACSLAQQRTDTWVADDRRHNAERGFLGTCELVRRNIRKPDLEALCWAVTLARFAEFAGVGIETTRGMGHVNVELLV